MRRGVGIKGIGRYLEGQLVVGPGGDDVRVRHLGADVVQRGQHAAARQHRARQRRQRRQPQQRARLLDEQLRRLRAWTIHALTIMSLQHKHLSMKSMCSSKCYQKYIAWTFTDVSIDLMTYGLLQYLIIATHPEP